MANDKNVENKNQKIKNPRTRPSQINKKVRRRGRDINYK